MQAMRIMLGAAVVSLAAVGPVDAQQTPGTPRAAAVGGQAVCAPGADSARTFQRAIGDSVAGARPVQGGTARSRQYPEYDVVLEVPGVCVDRITLRVDSLTAKLALDARVANLVRINVGADVLVDSVDLTIEGIRARVLLLVDLDNVVHVVDQTLTFIDNNPQVVDQLTSTLRNTGEAAGGLVGGLVRSLVLTTSRLADGRSLQKVVEQATGSIVERTLSAAGAQLSQRVIGNLLQLTPLQERTNVAGETVRQVRDQTGSLIEYTLDRATNAIRSARVIGGSR